jgi:hypothetical protein
MGIFGGFGLEELAPRRRIEEQVLNIEGRAGCARGRGGGGDAATFSLDGPGMLGVGTATRFSGPVLKGGGNPWNSRN